jgi:NAD(P)-dependent dehydrogenase (short-subunit alcohol dehydrogenase family)
MASGELSGASALVTGGNSGIGRATVVALAGLGAQVALQGRNAARGEQVVEQVRQDGGTAVFLPSDLRDEDDARALAREAKKSVGQIDILVNNAGIYPAAPTAKTTEELFDEVIALNVKAPYFLVAELAPEMAKRGHGAIINVSTMAAEIGIAGMALYGASKAAVVLLTKAWAAEFGPHGVRVNTVSPGPIRTEGTASSPEVVARLAAAAPAGRPGTPEEVAAAIVFLATDRAGYIQGASLPVDGGRIAV